MNITGRIGKSECWVTFKGGAATFTRKPGTLKHVEQIWFVYFQRVSKTLKMCDAVFFDGHELIEFTTSQKNIDKITDAVSCACYLGGLDPLPWKRILRDAKKNEWDIDDWQYHLEADSASESESESDGEWQPDDEVSDSDSESDVEDDEPPVKRRRVAVVQNDPSSVSV